MACSHSRPLMIMDHGVVWCWCWLLRTCTCCEVLYFMVTRAQVPALGGQTRVTSHVDGRDVRMKSLLHARTSLFQKAVLADLLDQAAPAPAARRLGHGDRDHRLHALRADRNFRL